jgi:hypothetical protein
MAVSKPLQTNPSDITHSKDRGSATLRDTKSKKAKLSCYRYAGDKGRGDI